MILHDFPDLVWLRQQVEARFSLRRGWNGQVLPREGWPTVVLDVQTPGTYRNHTREPLSLFMNIAGEGHLETGRQRTTFKEGFFL